LARRSTLFYLTGTVGVLAVVGGVIAVALIRRAAAEHEGEQRAAQVARGPLVRVRNVELSPPVRKIELQGEARPYLSVTLYAKVSGYLREIRVDKGDAVKPNQVVAVIESPELDRQYDAAVADAAYKKANATRAATLARPGVVSAAEAEVQVGQAKVAEAQVAQLAQQKSYEVLRAPFAGRVTARFADPGALVQAAVGAQTGALPLVTISTPERLRVFVYADQRDAPFIHVGDAAEITLPDRGEVRIHAKVARLAQELDARTRMMLTEVDVDNSDGRVLPGSFVNVTLSYARPQEVQVPVEALVMRDRRAFVPVIEGDIVHYRAVEVADDDGATARLRRGLRVGEVVALNLGDQVAEGARVQPVAADAARAQPAAEGVRAQPLADAAHAQPVAVDGAQPQPAPGDRARARPGAAEGARAQPVAGDAQGR
jgi:RND family efflux transporter MFP subunit